ncbi:fimbrial protein FimH [Leptospira interrogans serovar Lai]|nr:fimbrial protein FimH [Leptospira interrogans serovar Lai]
MNRQLNKVMYKYFISITLLFFSFCIKSPAVLDPPYFILQYLQNVNSTENQGNNSNNNNSQCPAPAGPFNPGAIFDTGQTLCWNGAGTVQTCALWLPGADGDFNNVPNARSFVGPTQHCKFTSDYTIFDPLHGLTWKACAQGQTGSDCSGSVAAPINWADANAGLSGSCTELNTLNSGEGYAGRTNWRIPTVRELASIVHYTNNPHIENAFFPSRTFTGRPYMTSTIDARAAGNNWAIDFSVAPPMDVRILSTAQATSIYLRCVSGNAMPVTSFVDQGDGTIRDLNTGLLWAQCSEGQGGVGCMFGGIGALEWNQARGNCNGKVLVPGRVWRLPNINELLSIIDYSDPNPILPTIDTIFFPNTPNPSGYWTSTTYDSNKSLAIAVAFGNGIVATSDKSGTLYARCVTTF